MVMDLLGPDMEHLLEFLNKRTFTAKTGKSFPLHPTRLSHQRNPSLFHQLLVAHNNGSRKAFSFQVVLLPFLP
jgi:hypothetical protein